MGWWRCEGISWPVGQAPGLVLSWTWWWASFFDHQQISTATFTRANLNHLPLGGSQKLGLAESRWMMGVMVLQGAIGSLRRRVFDTFHDSLQWRACGGGSLPAAWHVGHGEVAFSGSAVPQTLPKDTKYPPVNPTWQWKITHLDAFSDFPWKLRFSAGLITEGYSNSFSGPANPRLAARSDPQKCSVWGFTALHIAVEERGTQIKSNLKLKGCYVFEPKYSNPNKMDTQ